MIEDRTDALLTSILIIACFILVTLIGVWITSDDNSTQHENNLPQAYCWPEAKIGAWYAGDWGFRMTEQEYAVYCEGSKKGE